VGLFLDTADLRQFNRTPIAHVFEDHGTVPKAVVNQAGAWMQRGSMGMCKAQIFIDGFEVPANGGFRLLGLGADEVHGVEIYSRTLLPPAGVGAEIGDYGGAPMSQRCGAVAVWTKRFHAEVQAKAAKGAGSTRIPPT
jgi:hypothetical protein